MALIDGNGKIAYMGHPAGTDLERDINTLMKGESLASAAKEGGASGSDDKYKELDLGKVHEDLEKFRSTVSSLGNDEAVKAGAKDFVRDFVVLVKIMKFDAEKKKILTNFENVNVLVGPKSAIEAVSWNWTTLM